MKRNSGCERAKLEKRGSTVVVVEVRIGERDRPSWPYVEYGV